MFGYGTYVSKRRPRRRIDDTFWLADRIRLFVHSIILLSPLRKRIWRHWTYKMPFRYLSTVWVRLSIFSQLSIIKYMGLCVFNLPISTVMIQIIYTLSYYHHQIGSMNYYPLFRVRSWNNGMHCMFLYILMMRGHTVFEGRTTSLIWKHMNTMATIMQVTFSNVFNWYKIC